MGDIELASDQGDPVYPRLNSWRDSWRDAYRIAFVSRSRVYFEEVPKDVSLKYNRFNESRVAQKKNVYFNIMTRGWIIFAAGLILLVVSYIFNIVFIENSGAYEFGIAFGLLGYFLLPFGFVCVSSVPTDEVDMDEVIENKEKPNRKYIISIAFSLINFVSGGVTGLFPPYLGFIFVLNALWIIKPVLYQEKKFNFMVKMAFGSHVSLLVISSLFLVCAVSPETIVSKNFAGANGEAWQQWADNINEHRLTLGLFFGMLASLFFIAWIVSGLLCLRYFYKCSCKELVYLHESERKRGYTTTLFHIVVYAIMISLGIYNILYGTMSIFVQITSDYYANNSYYSLPYIFNGTLTLIPVLVMFKLGKVKMFSLMARKFEYDPNRLKEDGAFMAELINSTTVVYEDDIRWFQRHEHENLLDPENNDGTYVNRMYFAKGIVKEVTSTAILLEIRYDDDISLDWQVQFKVDENSMALKQVVTGVNLYGHNTGKLQLTFDEWFSKNFSDKCKHEIVRVDKELGIVTIREKISEETMPTRRYLLDWALENFRCFHFSNNKFKDDLFLKSPRELADDDERKTTFALSHEHKSSLSSAHSSSSALTIRFISRLCTCSGDTSQVDYFISHSWNDDARKKCEILRDFSNQFKLKKGKEPTYWFDKVCIDQSRVNDSDYYALHVLPVNISSCKQVLVLLGRTYMKRLWCLWELYCLFVFCNKELALDRVEVKLLHEEDAGTVFYELAKFKLTEGNPFVHSIIIPT